MILILIMWIIHVPILFNKSQNDKISGFIKSWGEVCVEGGGGGGGSLSSIIKSSSYVGESVVTNDWCIITNIPKPYEENAKI